MKRPFWLATGVALGVGGTLWAEQRVRRGVEQLAQRLSPDALARQAGRSVVRTGDRVREAVVVGRQERDRRAEELWEGLGEPARHRPAWSAAPELQPPERQSRRRSRPSSRAPGREGLQSPR